MGNIPRRPRATPKSDRRPGFRYLAHPMTSPRSTLVCTILVVSCLFPVGCGGGKSVARTGFVPMSVPLTPSADDDETAEFRLSTLSTADFGSVRIEPVTRAPGAIIELEDEDWTKLKDVMRGQLETALAPAAGTGTKTLVVHAAFTYVKPNTPGLNVAPQTQMMKLGYGEAACEIYATIEGDPKVVAAFSSETDTKRFSTEKLSRLGTAERACEEWAKAFRNLLP